jgi:hypothetical protein
MAKQVILERVEPFNKVIDEPFAKLIGDDEGVAPRSRSAPSVDDRDTSDSRSRLRLAYEDMRRSYPNLDDATYLGRAWRRISRGDRDAILAEEDAGEDPTFDHENVDVGKLADFALECRAAAIRKAQPHLTPSQAFAAACDAKPELFKVVREARRAKLVSGNTEPDEAVIAKRLFALQLLTKHAEQLIADNPGMSIQAGRVEARRLHPELAARERA